MCQKRKQILYMHTIKKIKSKNKKSMVHAHYFKKKECEAKHKKYGGSMSSWLGYALIQLEKGNLCWSLPHHEMVQLRRKFVPMYTWFCCTMIQAKVSVTVPQSYTWFCCAAIQAKVSVTVPQSYTWFCCTVVQAKVNVIVPLYQWR